MGVVDLRDARAEGRGQNDHDRCDSFPHAAWCSKG
jgi:hypothetical protein